MEDHEYRAVFTVNEMNKKLEELESEFKKKRLSPFVFEVLEKLLGISCLYLYFSENTNMFMGTVSVLILKQYYFCMFRISVFVHIHY